MTPEKLKDKVNKLLENDKISEAISILIEVLNQEDIDILNVISREWKSVQDKLYTNTISNEEASRIQNNITARLLSLNNEFNVVTRQNSGQGGIKVKKKSGRKKKMKISKKGYYIGILALIVTIISIVIQTEIIFPGCNRCNDSKIIIEGNVFDNNGKRLKSLEIYIKELNKSEHTDYKGYYVFDEVSEEDWGYFTILIFDNNGSKLYEQKIKAPQKINCVLKINDIKINFEPQCKISGNIRDCDGNILRNRTFTINGNKKSTDTDGNFNLLLPCNNESSQITFIVEMDGYLKWENKKNCSPNKVTELIINLKCPPPLVPFYLEKECEQYNTSTIGQPISRNNASNGKAFGQFGCIEENGYEAKAGYVEYQNINIPSIKNLFIKIRYSKNNYSGEKIDIHLDGIMKESFTPKNTGGLNFFDSTEYINLGAVRNGRHIIKFFTNGQRGGTADLDKFILSNNK